MKRIILACIMLAGCSTTQVYSNYPAGTMAGTNTTGQIAVLYSTPSRPYEVLGVVSANRYKPGWTDPTVNDAIPQLRAAGLQLGADAIIVRSSRSLNDRHTDVEAEAIRYTDGLGPTPQRAAPQSQQSQSRELDPAKRCDACGNLNNHL
jgi:hypothetical protein